MSTLWRRLLSLDEEKIMKSFIIVHYNVWFANDERSVDAHATKVPVYGNAHITRRIRPRH